MSELPDSIALELERIASEQSSAAVDALEDLIAEGNIEVVRELVLRLTNAQLELAKANNDEDRKFWDHQAAVIEEHVAQEIESKRLAAVKAGHDLGHALLAGLKAAAIGAGKVAVAAARVSIEATIKGLSEA